MEARGQVNMYVEYRDSQMSRQILASLRKESPVQRHFFTVNLAHGVTPFIMHFNGVECASVNYRFVPGVEQVHITVAYYRPSANEFKAAERFVKDHILRGGLLPLPLEKAILCQLDFELDPIKPTMNFEEVQAAMLALYGERLPDKFRPPGLVSG